jgi:NHL repeat
MALSTIALFSRSIQPLKSLLPGKREPLSSRSSPTRSLSHATTPICTGLSSRMDLRAGTELGGAPVQTTPLFRAPGLIPGWEQLPVGQTRWEVSDVAVDGADQVYALTRGPGAVLVYDAGGRFLRSFAEGQLAPRPHAITVAPNGTIFVVDERVHVVRVFDPTGEQVQVIGEPGVPSETGYDETVGTTSWCTTILRPAGPFNHPTKVCLGADGGIYVSDGYANSRIHQFDAAGNLIRSWGEPGTGPGEFNVPHSLCLLADGRLAVADRENDRIQIFTLKGEFLGEWANVQRPSSIVQDSAGRIWVAELAWRSGERSPRRGLLASDEPARLTVLDADGTILGRSTYLAGPEGPQPLVALPRFDGQLDYAA